MATETTPQIQPANPPARSNTASPGGSIADLLTQKDSGVRITGLVLSAELPKEFKGVSKGGSNYAFSVREVQIWTGNKAVLCKDQRDLGGLFPPIELGVMASYKVKSVRMNGTVPVFEIDTE